MGIQRNYKKGRPKPNRKAALKRFNRALAIGSVATLATVGAVKTKNLITARKAESIRRIEMERAQSRAYWRGLSKMREAQTAKEEALWEKRTNAIKDAIAKGKIPRSVNGITMEYIDPPSGEGVKRFHL